MRKILGMSLAVVLALGVGSYALGHGSSAKGRGTASSGQMMGSGGMMGQGMMTGMVNGRGMMMGHGGMMGGSGIMGMGRSMMDGVTNFIDMCRTMVAGWFGPGGSLAPEDPYNHRERRAQRTERGIQ